MKATEVTISYFRDSSTATATETVIPTMGLLPAHRKSISQLELSMIRARVRSGMENAKAKGKQIGRPQVTADDVPSGFLRHYPAYKRGQLNVSELARVCNISRTTAYKYIGLLEN